MPASWKQYERKNCDILSKFFFGVDKPKGGRIDKDLPLCRAADSGSHPSEIRRGDIVPNGKWIREGTLKDIHLFPFVIELKYVKGINLSELFQAKSQFYKHWEQAATQSIETGEAYIPLLIVNRVNSSQNFVIVDREKYFKYARTVPLPMQQVHVKLSLTQSLSIFLLSDWIEINTKPPYQHLIR